MLKRFVILGLVLSLAGTAALGWVLAEKRKELQKVTSYKSKYSSEPDKYLRQYDEWSQLPVEEQTQLSLAPDKHSRTKTEAQLLQEQQERLKADLDKLAAGQMDAHPFADILYGENWQEELSRYKKQRELKEFIFTSSIVCASIGGTISTGCLLLWVVQLLLKGLSDTRGFFADVLRRRKESKDKQQLQACTQEGEKKSEQGQKQNSQQSQLTRHGEGYAVVRKKHSKVLANSGWYNFETDFAGFPFCKRKQNEAPANQQQVPSQAERSSKATPPAPMSEKIAVLLSDKESTESEESLIAATKSLDGNTLQLDLPESTPKTALLNPDENSPKLEGSLKAQAENLEKQIAEFRQMAQSVQQSTLRHSKPLNSTLKELTQQISAIRQYTAYQQDRVEKLQDGYDWNIIRTFCLRVIRCIDNLENRISQLAKQDIETGPNLTIHLEEVRDELLFALESSGVEQFEPEVNSDYRGQEKHAEAVKEKQHCDDPNQIGKIAEVVRPGYQYLINEENVKVVRAARVKLFA